MSDQIRSDKKIDYLFTSCWEDTKAVKAWNITSSMIAVILNL